MLLSAPARLYTGFVGAAEPGSVLRLIISKGGAECTSGYKQSVLAPAGVLTRGSLRPLVDTLARTTSIGSSTYAGRHWVRHRRSALSNESVYAVSEYGWISLRSDCAQLRGRDMSANAVNDDGVLSVWCSSA